MAKPKYKTADDLFRETLEEARKLTKQGIRIALRQRAAMHAWAVKAYEQALAEKITKQSL